MKYKSQEALKQEVISATDGAKNFDDMMVKIALYIQENFTYNSEEAEVVQ